MMGRPNLYVVLGALDACVNGKGYPDDIEAWNAVDGILDAFTADERALAAVELDAWLEVQP